jgi:hypothetical protein
LQKRDIPLAGVAPAGARSSRAGTRGRGDRRHG